MRGKTLRDLKYLKQNYKPSEIQNLLNSSKLKREVYQKLGVSEYVLNNYIKHYKLSNIHKNRQRSLIGVLLIVKEVDINSFSAKISWSYMLNYLKFLKLD